MSKEILKTKEEKIIEHAGYKMHQEFKANELDVKYLEYRYFELLKKGLIPKGYKDLTDCRLSHINSVCHSQRNPEMKFIEGIFNLIENGTIVLNPEQTKD